MEKKSKWMYFIPVLYLIVSYGLFFLPSGNSFDFKLMVIGIPCVMGIINLVIVLTIGRKWPRKVLLNCALLIKYALIPFYLISGCLTGYFIATIFIPLLLIRILLGIVSVTLLIYLYMVLLGAVPYSMAYIIRSYKEGANSIGVALVVLCLCIIFVWI